MFTKGNFLLFLLYILPFIDDRARASALSGIKKITVRSGVSCSARDADGLSFNPKDCGEDSFFKGGTEIIPYFGITDGVGKDYNSFIIARLLMDHCKSASDVTYLNSTEILINGHRSMKNDPQLDSKNRGSTTAVVLGIDQQSGIFHATNIGDSGFVIIRNDKVFLRSKDLEYKFNHPYQIFHFIDLKIDSEKMVYQKLLIPGDIIIIATDGLWDNLFLKNIIDITKQEKIANKGVLPQTIAENLVQIVKTLRMKKQYPTPFRVEKIKLQYSTEITERRKKNKNADISDILERQKKDINNGLGKNDDIAVIVLFIEEQQVKEFDQQVEAEIKKLDSKEINYLGNQQQNPLGVPTEPEVNAPDPNSKSNDKAGDGLIQFKQIESAKEITQTLPTSRNVKSQEIVGKDKEVEMDPEEKKKRIGNGRKQNPVANFFGSIFKKVARYSCFH